MINDFNKFYTFMEIVRQRSFSRASKVLNISQPAVTLQIKKLEEMLKTTLVMRKKNGIVLTREGEKFYKLCLQFENSMYRFKDEILRIKSDTTPLVIATTQLIGETFVSILLDKIANVTQAELDIRIKPQDELITHLKDRRSDICLIFDQTFDDSLLTKKLFEYEIVLVSNRKIADSIKACDLMNFKFIKDTTKDYIADILQKHGVSWEALPVAYSLDGSIMVKRAILNNNANEYVAFVPRFLVDDAIKNGQLFEINISKLKITRSVYAIALRENEAMLSKFLHVKDNFKL